MSGVPSRQPVDVFIADVRGTWQTGKATEHSYRPALKALLESLKTGIRALNEPKREECGAPDFVALTGPKGSPAIVGYLEAKDVGENLDAVEKSDQLKRYRGALRNLVLTNHIEFRWYRDGKLRGSAHLASIAGVGRLKVEKAGAVEVASLLGDFLDVAPTGARSAEDLALTLARLTHLIRDIIVETQRLGRTSQTLLEIRKVIADTILPEIAQPDRDGQFADMFSQTLAYGLFAARVNHSPPGPFRRDGAAHEIPRLNPFLRRLFELITGTALEDEPFADLVEDLVQVLNLSDMDSILSDFGPRAGGKDPIFHFYETYLAAYDAKLRKKRGVYYTPQEVVSFMVRAVDQILVSRFGCTDGLADSAEAPYSFVELESQDSKLTPVKKLAKGPRVLVLDPACGTGTFLYSVVDLIRGRFRDRGDAGIWSSYVREHLLTRLYGFELLMAPYAIAHLKLALQLSARDLPAAERNTWACRLESQDRLGIYLTNSLDPPERTFTGYFGPMAHFVVEEAKAASAIKNQKPIMVVLGNPPYSGESENKNPWIQDLVEDYRRKYPDLSKPGQGKWLQNDYVKFVRLGEWRIERTGAGVVAYITDNGYLENTTFKGMREHLLSTFSEIFVLDLRGSQTKRELGAGPDRDQNVFDIKQGVAISLFIREPGKTGPAKVHYAALSGSRDSKCAFLSSASLDSISWSELTPSSPRFSMLPEGDPKLRREYEAWPSLTEIFDQNGDPAPGLVSTHDEFAVSWTRDEAIQKVKDFLTTRDESEARAKWRLCSQAQWNYERAKATLSLGAWEPEVAQILYRPFDIRWTVLNSNVFVHRRERATSQMIGHENVALVFNRREEIRDKYAHFLCTDLPPEHGALSPKTTCYFAPLYLFGSQADLRDDPPEVGETPRSRRVRANLDPGLMDRVSKSTGLAYLKSGAGEAGKSFGPDDFFDYVYAVVHSPAYRRRFESLLKEDFPRVPLPKSAGMFLELAKLGGRLRELHLLSPGAVPTNQVANFPVPGSDVVGDGFPEFRPPTSPGLSRKRPGESGRVHINIDQYFEPVPSEVWDFRVGAYQVCRKWLLDRRGRKLTFPELRSYGEIVGAIVSTIEIGHAVDRLLP